MNRAVSKNISGSINKNKSAGWRAEVSLEFKNPRGKSVLGRCRRMGPLTFQRPFYPEGGVCHLYLLHPPGGVVGGDSIILNANIKEDASALITTPGATKFYRSAGESATQKQDFFIAPGAVLEWFPQETIVFPGAIPKISTEVNLDEESTFFGWEILCLGRPASGEIFNKGSLKTRFTLKRNGLPVFNDHIRIDNNNRPGNELLSAPGLRGFPVTATFIATSVTKKMLLDLRDIAEAKKDDNSNIRGMTLINDLLVARYLGNDPEEAKKYFISIWGYLRKAVLGRDLCIPRIWAT